MIAMIDAIYAALGKNGYWMANGEFEYNVVLIAVALIGPGDFVLFYKKP